MLARRAVKRHPGGVTVRLAAGEERFIEDVVRTIVALVDGVDADRPLDALQGRLLPRAYDDPLEQAEFADTMMGALVEGKMDALRAVHASLSRGVTARGSWSVDLEHDDAAAWLAVVNDGRLVLGRLAGITTEADWDTLPDEQPDQAAMLGYLGWLQEQLVEALLG